MQNPDLITRRLLAIALLVCSASLFVFSLSTISKSYANAPASMEISPADLPGLEGKEGISFGTKDGWGYYLSRYSDGSAKLFKVDLKLASEADIVNKKKPISILPAGCR